VSFQPIKWSTEEENVYVGCASCVLPLNGQFHPKKEEVEKLLIGSTFLHSSLMPLSTKKTKDLAEGAQDDGTAEYESNASEQVCHVDSVIEIANPKLYVCT